jgi:DNA-binding LacI/PurR family transcriptional regulator
VLNASAAVRAATRERVLAAAEVLDYRLPAVGGAAAGRRATRALGLVIKEDDNPYYAGLVAGVRAVADAHGYVLLVASSEGDVRAERRAVELLQAKDVDGLLLTPVLGDEAEADLSPLFDLKRRGVPFVLLESVRGVPASLVDVDNVRASCAAAEHLVALGHTRLAHFAGPAYSTHTHERVQGVRHAASASAAVFTDAHVVTAGAHLEDGYRAALAYFGGLPAAERPTGVTCYNDLIALGVCRALRELGLRVPEDVSVVGFDDIPLLEYLNVPLTSVRVPVAEMGARAAELLVAQLGGAGHGAPPTPPERHLVRAELVVRASTAPPPA